MQEQMELYKFRCTELINNGLALEELNNYKNFEDMFSAEDFKNILREKQNRKNKRYRTKNKFIELYKLKMVIKNSKIVFGTITLNNYYLNLKENTYIRQIHKWLKSHFEFSILNKDFGSKTEREHYHFIGLTTEDLKAKKCKSKTGYQIYELKNKDYKMGFEPTLCLVDLKINDIQKTIEYLLKLNNHSNKLGTKNRVRILKNNRAKMAILLNEQIDQKNAVNKAKKQFYDKIKNTSYDTLNKRSVSEEISVDEFIKIISLNN